MFSELHSLVADHEYLVKKTSTDVTPVQAFAVSSSSSRNMAAPPAVLPAPSSDQIQALSNLLSQFSLQTQPQRGGLAQAFYANRGNNNNHKHGQNRNSAGNNHGNYNNRNNGYKNQNNEGNRSSQFPWASNQNTVFGTCNKCGIGHMPSQCPNHDPSTFKRSQPLANYVDYLSQTVTSWLPDTGSSHHVASDLLGFDNSEPYYGNDNFRVGNGKGLPILHIGSSKLYSLN